TEAATFFIVKPHPPKFPAKSGPGSRFEFLDDSKGSQPKPDRDFEAELTQEQINRYYLDFERLFYRVERSNTHYQVLGIDRNSSIDEIKVAYQTAVALLQPFLAGAFRSSTLDTRNRARHVLRKISEAFTVVSNIGKRIEYDNALFRRAPGRLPLDIPESFNTKSVSFGRKSQPDGCRPTPGHTAESGSRPGESALGFERIRAEEMIRPAGGLDPSGRLGMSYGGGATLTEAQPVPASPSENRRRVERIMLTVIAPYTGR